MRIPLSLVLMLAAAPVAAQTDLTVMAPGSGETAVGPASNFTGHVEVSRRLPTLAPSRLGGAFVSFEAGAHTAWHTHPLGQTLHIVEGCGWVQVEGMPAREVAPGTVVVIPPETRHWHGASAAAPMTHLALSETLDGSSVTWMEHVAPEVYAAAEGAEATCG